MAIGKSYDGGGMFTAGIDGERRTFLAASAIRILAACIASTAACSVNEATLNERNNICQNRCPGVPLRRRWSLTCLICQ